MVEALLVHVLVSQHINHKTRFATPSASHDTSGERGVG